MKSQSINKNWQHAAKNVLVPVAVALAFFALVFLYYPFREKIQFDGDEGLNLMRSMLLVLDYPLYSEVTSDQPPLFTYLLSFILRIAGFEVGPARLFVLLFSTILVWAGAQSLQLARGKLAALLFLPLIVITPRYLVLSVSVMIGLPSITLAMVSLLGVMLWHVQKKNGWLALSGFALGLSVLIKLFTGFLAPIFLIGLTLAAYAENKKDGFSWKIFRPAFIWGLCFASLVIFLGVGLVGFQNLWQIIYPHLAAPAEESLQSIDYTLRTHLQPALPLIVLAIWGALVSIYKKNWLMLYPLSCAVSACIMFSFYSPVFYHHLLLITIPAAMFGALAVEDAIQTIGRIRQPSLWVRAQSILGVAVLVCFGLILYHYAPVLDSELLDRPQLSDFSLKATAGKIKVVSTMNEYSAQTNWIVTDMPMYAFIVKRPVPPILATFSRKRLETGSLTEADVIAAVREYQPEQVLMARFTMPNLIAYLQENYTLVISPEFFNLYIRNDLLQTTH